MEDITRLNELSGLPGDDAQSRLELLTNLIEDLSFEQDIDQMAIKALCAATQLIGVDAGSVAMFTDDGEHLYYRWHVWQGDEGTISEMQRPFRFTHGVAGKALRSGKTETIEDYASYDDALQSFVAAGVCSVLATPLYDLSGQALGVLSLANLNQQYEFNPARVRLAEAVARQFSAAIQRHDLLEDLQKSSRTLRTLSACNEAMMHADSEDDLLQRVCEVIVSTEGYLGAWVAFKGDDSFKSLTPCAVAGVDMDSLLEVEYSWDESKEGEMPPGRAIRTGKSVHIDNVFLESGCECCRKLALEVGYQSVLALPLIIDAITVGVLVIYARDIKAFSDKEISLLTELGRDLSFGLQTLRVRKARYEAVLRLRASERKFKAIFDNTYDGILVVDSKTGIIKEANGSISRILGYTEQELIGFMVEDIHPPEIMDVIQTKFQNVVDGKATVLNDLPVLCKDGTVRYVDISTARITIDEDDYLIDSFRDITERKQDTQLLARTNLALRTLSRCNEILTQASEEQQLLDDICHAIVELGEYKLVWVGLVEDDKKKTIRIASQYGEATAILADVHITGMGPGADQGPSGRVIRSGNAELERFISHGEYSEPWRYLASEHGLASFIALPLSTGDDVLGVLNIYSHREDDFDSEESNLLMDLAQDLAYGITSQRVRTKYQQGIQTVKRSEHDLRSIINHEADGIMVLDVDNTILFANPALMEMLGRDSGSLIGSQFGTPITSGESSEIELLNSNNESLQCEMRVTDVDWLGKPARLVSVHDISELIKLEQEREKSAAHQREMLVETITAMSNAVETRDPYTAGHMRRVSDLSVAIAEQMGLEKDQIEGIRLGGIIHDIGKLYVPAEILNRPGRLSKNEFEIIKSHAQVGYDIIKGISFSWPVAEMVYQHHERIDGTGYPNGLKGDEIVLEARILAVADVVEAMSSHRPYRPSLGLAPALDEINKNRGVFYDADVVDACIKVIETGGYQS